MEGGGCANGLDVGCEGQQGVQRHQAFGPSLWKDSFPLTKGTGDVHRACGQHMGGESVRAHLHQYTTQLLSLNVHACKMGQHSPSLPPRVWPSGSGKPGAEGELSRRGPVVGARVERPSWAVWSLQRLPL